MSRILLLYASVEGQTTLIAERIAQTLREGAHSVDMLSADTNPAKLNPAAYAGVIIGASIHYGHHPAYLRKLLRRHGSVIAARPSAFFSVSLSAGGPRPKPAAAEAGLSGIGNRAALQASMRTQTLPCTMPCCMRGARP